MYRIEERLVPRMGSKPAMWRPIRGLLYTYEKSAKKCVKRLNTTNKETGNKRGPFRAKQVRT